ncbi:hypothetical protein TNCV_2072671 [Trichonephila clavipes]|nr:hypothetical protein TNCV_2072671 [Trichonephila clavipes]
MGKTADLSDFDKGQIFMARRLGTSITVVYEQSAAQVLTYRIMHPIKRADCQRMTDALFNGLLCKAVSTSATFIFIMNALPDRFHLQSILCNRCAKSVILDAFGAVSPGYFS